MAGKLWKSAAESSIGPDLTAVTRGTPESILCAGQKTVRTNLLAPGACDAAKKTNRPRDRRELLPVHRSEVVVPINCPIPVPPVEF